MIRSILKQAIMVFGFLLCLQVANVADAYYASQQGRFINRDPIGYLDGKNLYAGYFAPTSLDPTGTQLGGGGAQRLGPGWNELLKAKIEYFCKKYKSGEIPNWEAGVIQLTWTEAKQHLPDRLGYGFDRGCVGIASCGIGSDLFFGGNFPDSSCFTTKAKAMAEKVRLKNDGCNRPEVFAYSFDYTNKYKNNGGYQPWKVNDDGSITLANDFVATTNIEYDFHRYDERFDAWFGATAGSDIGDFSGIPLVTPDCIIAYMTYSGGAPLTNNAGVSRGTIYCAICGDKRRCHPMHH